MRKRRISVFFVPPGPLVRVSPGTKLSHLIQDNAFFVITYLNTHKLSQWTLHQQLLIIFIHSENVTEIEIRLLRHNGLNLIEYTSDLFALVVLKFDELR